ncbi:hypothetical protein GCM10025873_23180 [Demequina sediminis]|nr:hypothetical protein GCM10025873_23180 [Demequina sediminis]
MASRRQGGALGSPDVTSGHGHRTFQTLGAPMPTLSFSHVSFAWPDGRRVFDDLTTAVPEGLSALVGRNGIGKSTLLRLALGELTPTAGTISTAGRLAYVPQDLILGVDARVIDVLGVAPGSTP